MKLLFLWLYRSVWIGLLFWSACIILGLYGGYMLATYLNQQEKEDQLHIKQEIQETLNPHERL